MKILNLGAGKVDLNELNPDDFTVCVDRCYASGYDIDKTEDSFITAKETVVFCKSGIFEFADSFKFKFDKVVCERIFEHMEYLTGEVGRLLEAINTLTVPGGILEIVVPNALLIAKKLTRIESSFRDGSVTVEDMNDLLIVTSESNNIRQDPHLSVWTPNLARFYIEQEGIWDINGIDPKIKFAGRDIYMRIVCTKKL